MTTKNGDLLEQVKEATQSLTNWADVSNALFDSEAGPRVATILTVFSRIIFL